MKEEVLICFYTENKFDEPIEKALEKQGLKHGDVKIIAIPEKLKNVFINK